MAKSMDSASTWSSSCAMTGATNRVRHSDAAARERSEIMGENSERGFWTLQFNFEESG
ncbi:hypothetical protein D3C87_2161150 [compost metagenome]